MAKYFLGSVGTAEAFRMVNGELQLAFVSKTLTDSGLNISTTKDDIRAGTGAPIQFSFYHDPSVEITLTDVIFNEAYVEAQLGTTFKFGGEEYKSEEKTVDADNGSITLDDYPLPLNLGCGRSETVAWYALAGSEDWQIAHLEAGTKEITGLNKGTYCIRYLHQNANAKVAKIMSDMIPEELYLVITAPIFAGDACSASNGKKAGTITYEVPRFKLNGAQEFSMNMSSNQTMSISGIALASVSGCDMNSSELLRIITVYTDQHWYDDAKSLIADEEHLAVGDTPVIYAEYNNGSVSVVDNEELTFEPALAANGTFASAGSVSIKAKEKESLVISVTVTE